MSKSGNLGGDARQVRRTGLQLSEIFVVGSGLQVEVQPVHADPGFSRTTASPSRTASLRLPVFFQ